MVKADPKQDYYADLELTSSATEEDVKRKFRLLGTPVTLEDKTNPDTA